MSVCLDVNEVSLPQRLVEIYGHCVN